MGDWRYMPHSGYGFRRGENREKVAIPEKGRNAGIALKQELPEDYDTDFLLDVLNGAGKLYAKEGFNRLLIERAVEKLDPIEFKDTDRNFKRPVFSNLKTDNKEIESFSNDPFETEADRLYQGFDQLIERYCSVNEINQDFESLAEEIAIAEGYELVDSFKYDDEDGEVKWGAIGNDLSVEPEEVLLPEKFKKIGKAVAERYWDTEFNYNFFNQFSGKDEEEILAETPKEVAGVYMWRSGDTLDEYDLYRQTEQECFKSKLGLFQNQYKNSEKTSSQR